MKIIQFIPHLASGGAERFVVDLSNELIKNRNDVIICTLSSLSDSKGFYVPQLDPKIKVIQLNKGNGFSFKTMLKFANLVRKERPNVIHTHLRSLPYAVLPFIMGYKGVHTIHNDAPKEAKDWINRVCRKFLFRFHIATPVTISEESRNSFEHYYGYSAPLINNGRNIPSKIEVSSDIQKEFDIYKRTPNTRCIIQIARFEYQKQIPMMARVASRLEKEGYDFSIINIGNTNNPKEFEETMSQKPSCQYIIGERENPLEYLQVAKAFALSSSHEGLPISLVEALGVGAIPICTPVGGIKNLIEDGVNGLLSEDSSEQSYYVALKRYLEMNDDEINQMRNNAKDSYAPYSMTRCAKEYITIYEKLHNER